MSSDIIKKEMGLFQSSVKNLSLGVSKAANLWKDSKYQELSSMVSTVASMSRDVILAGDRCCSSVERFDKIASEKY